MNAMNAHALRRRVGRIGQCGTPNSISVIAESRPIHGTQNEGFTSAEQDDANRFQRIVHTADRFDPATAKRMVNRRRHVA